VIVAQLVNKSAGADRHQKLKRVFRVGIIAEIDQTFVDNFRARLGRDVATQVDIDLAGDFQIIRCPGVADRITEIDAPAATDRD
jgi:hypothetical protein